MLEHHLGQASTTFEIKIKGIIINDEISDGINDKKVMTCNRISLSWRFYGQSFHSKEHSFQWRSQDLGEGGAQV